MRNYAIDCSKKLIKPDGEEAHVFFYLSRDSESPEQICHDLWKEGYHIECIREFQKPNKNTKVND